MRVLCRFSTSSSYGIMLATLLFSLFGRYLYWSYRNMYLFMIAVSRFSSLSINAGERYVTIKRGVWASDLIELFLDFAWLAFTNRPVFSFHTYLSRCLFALWKFLYIPNQSIRWRDLSVLWEIQWYLKQNLPIYSCRTSSIVCYKLTKFVLRLVD